MGEFTSYLFARPSFVEGIGRLFDFGGTLNEYNYSLDEDQADQVALECDWHAIGQDLRAAVGEYRRGKQIAGEKQAQ
jgi:hypothetical protein